jgi:hypothetical protein
MRADGRGEFNGKWTYGTRFDENPASLFAHLIRIIRNVCQNRPMNMY